MSKLGDTLRQTEFSDFNAFYSLFYDKYMHYPKFHRLASPQVVLRVLLAYLALSPLNVGHVC